METILIKKKEFKVLETLSDNSYKVERKDKIYFAKIFTNRDEYEDYVYAKKHIYLCGVSTPKLLLKDKKTFSVLCEYIEGKSALDAIIEGDLKDIYYQLIFLNSFYAKNERINLDYSPKHWVLQNDKLYYLETIMMPFKNEESFTERYIKLWFCEFDNEISVA
jgi:tRNA A-37 threonylcarbamoyl transferase component Bud32